MKCEWCGTEDVWPDQRRCQSDVHGKGFCGCAFPEVHTPERCRQAMRALLEDERDLRARLAQSYNRLEAKLVVAAKAEQALQEFARRTIERYKIIEPDWAAVAERYLAVVTPHPRCAFCLTRPATTNSPQADLNRCEVCSGTMTLEQWKELHPEEKK